MRGEMMEATKQKRTIWCVKAEKDRKRWEAVREEM
jgi:hypothetical protein